MWIFILKKTIFKIVTLFAISQSVFSGQMGAVSDVSLGYAPFLSLETQFAASTAIAAKDLKNQPWGGRVAAGVSHPYRENLAVSAEMGWNYFGTVSTNTIALSGQGSDTNYSYNFPFSCHLSISGPDLLVGLSYRYKQVDLFLKAGTLFERVIYTAHIPNETLDVLASGYTVNVSGAGQIVIPVMETLPEIKVGFSYDLPRNWSVLFSYMHAFGSMPKLDIGATSTSAQVNWDANTPALTLDVFALGLKYHFDHI